MKRKLHYMVGLGIILSIMVLGGCGMGKELKISVDETQFYKNPLGITNIGDPFVLKASDGKYYCYPTSDPGNGYKVWVSEDMVNWDKQVINAFTKNRDGWASGDFWAPEVYEFDGKYYMYYSARWKDTGSLRVGVAVSDSPLGPFKDVKDAPMFDFGYAAIDAHIFIDDDGQGYLYYSRDCSENVVNNVNESHIYGVKLSADYVSVEGDPVLLTKPEQAWEMDSGNYRWNEGPFMLKRNGIYYLMYSGHCYADKRYSLGYATSDQPLGTFTKYENNPILHTQTNWSDISGPGHHSITPSPDGSCLYVVYHTHSVPAIGGGDRQVNIDVLGFREDGTLFVNGPTISQQLMPALMDEAVAMRKHMSIYKKDEKVDLLIDGEFALYSKGKMFTPVVPVEKGDVIEIKLDGEQTIKGLLIYDGAKEGEVLGEVRVEFSNGYKISELTFPEEAGSAAILQFEPMSVEWIKIEYKGKTPGALSEIILY